jgi:uncharacterized protein (TIGR02646 family)
MISFTKQPKPVQLTALLQKDLTDEFILTGKSVWNLSFIKDALLLSSHEKCCYCEANINEESKYMEVEHFHHKDTYKNEVVEWDNLLPSCKKCNGTKGAHDTVLEPIIDPSKVNPKDHLFYWRYRIKGKDDLGKMTVSVLDLNNQDRLVKKRFEIGNAIQDKLEELNELLVEYASGLHTHTKRKNRIIRGLKELMKQGLPQSIYASTSATIIITDEEYKRIKNGLRLLSLWDSELNDLEAELIKVML